jgi:hypothetical protein
MKYSRTFEVPIHAIKDVRNSTEISYREEDLYAVQKRLKGRSKLTPDISLGDFECRASIDWVTLFIFVQKRTQVQWIRDEINRTIGQSVYVKALSANSAGVTDEFEIRFQEPDLNIVQKAVEALDAKFDLWLFPIVRGLEISIDFTPRSPSQQLRSKLVGVMNRHLMPTHDIISQWRDRPRYSWGSSNERKSAALLSLGKRAADEMDFLLIANERDKPAYADATFYVGEQYSDCSWRIMDKTIDRQNPSAGTYFNLPEDKKRVRVEVTLMEGAIRKVGISTLAELRAYRFTTMQGHFFRFMLPTFTDTSGMPPGLKRSTKSLLERERRIKFLNTGVIGLMAFDAARNRRADLIRKDILAQFRNKGRQLVVKHRVGSGFTGSMVAYGEMNKKVETALRHLSERSVVRKVTQD